VAPQDFIAAIAVEIGDPGNGPGVVDGAAVIWDMNGASILASASIGTVGPAWHVANVGDYNGDGNADILWRNDNGALAVWVMNGFSVTSSGVAGYVDGTWGII